MSSAVDFGEVSIKSIVDLTSAVDLGKVLTEGIADLAFTLCRLQAAKKDRGGQ